MSWGRVLSSAAAVAAVGGAAVLAVGMGGASTGRTNADPTPFVLPTLTHSTYTAPAFTTSAASTNATTPASTTPAAPTTGPVAQAPATAPAPATVQVPAAPVSTRPAASAAPRSTVPAAAPVRTTTAAPKPAPRTTAAPRPAPVSGGPLPLRISTGTATRVITVVARSAGSTVATLQAWDRAPGGGWLRHGPAITAHVGADGLSTAPSETRSATPIGSFTLTQAFGYYANPGTGLPYFATTAADWWISQPGSLYNTHQRCSSGCGFTQGSPNEHLMYETPFYNYAVVIDYNTRNSATGVRQGAGSAFFLHVTDGSATAGCIAIPQANLVSIMRWLSPSAHPRILIGVA